MAKSALYEIFISRLEQALADDRYLESAWYSYAVLEDRCRSMLRNSGGEGQNRGLGKPITMLGPKLKDLTKRSKKDALLKSCFEHSKLDAWKRARNSLTHAMADGSLPLADIDRMAEHLAEDGAKLAREYASAARRLKKNRKQVPFPAL